MSYQPAPGMRVVCVDDDWRVDLGCPMPTKGTVCTIDAIVVVLGHPFLSFREFPEACRLGMFHYMRFKPVDETKLDVFRQALKKAPAPRERVEA